MRHLRHSQRTLAVLAFCFACQIGPTGCSKVKVVDMVPVQMSGETNQDSEPFLAVSLANPQLMTGTAFTPGLAGSAAPIYVSQDGGDTWILSFILPATFQQDITHAFGSGKILYTDLLTACSPCTFDEALTTDVTSPIVMTIEATRSADDQPFVRSTQDGLPFFVSDKIYIGNNDTSQSLVNGKTATVDLSVDGSHYSPIRLESRTSADIAGCSKTLPGKDRQDGPSIRPSFAKDGTVYAAYFGWRTFTGTCSNATVSSDVVVVRDDHGGAGIPILQPPFQALVDPMDRLPGIRVVQGVTINWRLGATIGQERIGSTLSLAADPNNSSRVYIAWADNTPTSGNYTIHVRNSIDRGLHWSNDLFSSQNSLNAALAIADNGTVGLLFQNLSNGSWATHLVQTKDDFQTTQDLILAQTPSNVPTVQFFPYLGDYVGLLAIGSEFRGIFCANNTPDLNNFPEGVAYQRKADFNSKTLKDLSGANVPVSIDLFYFSAPVVQ